MIALPTQVLPADEVDAAAGAGSWLSVISLAAPNSFYQILENARVYLWASAPGVLADESSLRIKCGATPLAPDDTRTAVRQATAAILTNSLHEEWLVGIAVGIDGLDGIK
jgi:hypothetical protein